MRPIGRPPLIGYLKITGPAVFIYISYKDMKINGNGKSLGILPFPSKVKKVQFIKIFLTLLQHYSVCVKRDVNFMSI